MAHRTIPYWLSAFFLMVLLAFAAALMLKRPQTSPAREAAKERAAVGKSFLEQERYNDAVREFKKAIASDPTYNPAYDLLVTVCTTHPNMLEEAIETLRSAAAVAPDNGTIHFHLGNLLCMKDLHEEAIKESARAIALGVKNADVYHNLAISYGQLDRHKEAVESYKKALELDPDNSDCHFNLGIEYEVANEADSALKEYKRAVQLDPNNVTKLLQLAALSHGVKEYGTAVRRLKKAISLDPGRRGARQALGKCYIDMNELEKAKRMLLGELARFPDAAHSHYLLGAIHSTQGKSDAAIREFRKAVSLQTDVVDDDTFRYYHALAQELRKQGRDDEAKRVLADSEALRRKELDKKYKK